MSKPSGSFAAAFISKSRIKMTPYIQEKMMPYLQPLIWFLLLVLGAIVFWKLWNFMGAKYLPGLLGVHKPGWVDNPYWFLAISIPISLGACVMCYFFVGRFESAPLYFLFPILSGLVIICLFSPYIPNPTVLLVQAGLALLLGISIWSLGKAESLSLLGCLSLRGLAGLFGIAFIIGSGYRYIQERRDWSTRAGQYSSPVRRIEARFATMNSNMYTFHRLAEDRYGQPVNFEGYLLGIEKANRYLIGVPPEAGDTQGWEKEILPDGKRYLADRKRTFLSHIVKYGPVIDTTKPIPSSFVFNLYGKDDDKSDSAYAEGFKSLDGLKTELEVASKSHSHILVICMGWNTDQQESIRNFNSLYGYLMEAAKSDPAFKPLVIGITWPSEWAGFQPLSYPVKADDADETGLVWVSYLLKKVLFPVQAAADSVSPSSAPKLVLIGHSFGTRVLTRALASIKYESKAQGSDSEKVNLFIGLQGAFSARRFVDTPWYRKGLEGAPYRELRKLRTRFVFTWSSHDKANPVAGYVTGASHIGGEFGYVLAEKNGEIFENLDSGFVDKLASLRGGDESSLTALKNKAMEKILLADASNIIKDHPYGKGGYAHSDIYKPEIGRFMWNLIRAYALP